MMKLRHFPMLIIMALYAISTVMGQSNDSEMSIEESYLQEALELMIIRETSRADTRDQKMIALEYIGNALERGSTNDELRSTLEYLSLEGTQNRTLQGGRLMNNFPDVRRQAAKYLGVVGTKEAKDTLVKICLSENEPMVLQEVVKSLGTIGMNDNNDTINAVVWVATRSLNSNAPSDLLAFTAVDTLDKLARKFRTSDPNAIQLLIRISEGPYVNAVKEQARQVLLNMRRYATQQQKS